MPLIQDRVWQTANSPGTGALNLVAKGPPYETIIAACGPGQVYYHITAQDGSAAEKGVGTATAGSPDTLSRDTVFRNSSGNATKVNFQGAVDVFVGEPAERSIYASADNGNVQFGNRVLTGLGAGSAVDHAPRIDQVGEIRHPSIVAVGGVIIIPMPSYVPGDIFRIDFTSVQSAQAPAYFRVSVNGGASFLAGSSEYNFTNLSAQNTTVANSAGALSYGALGTLPVGAGLFGHMYLYPASRSYRSRTYAGNASGLFQEMTGGFWNTPGTVTHLVIGAVGVSLIGGVALVLRKVQ